MGSEESVFVIKSTPATGPAVHSAEGAVELNRYKKGPSCKQQSETYIERQLLFVYFTEILSKIKSPDAMFFSKETMVSVSRWLIVLQPLTWNIRSKMKNLVPLGALVR